MTKTTIALSNEDLLLIQNALNEILNGPEAIEDWEFETRVGFKRAEATLLLEKIGSAIDQPKERP
jgi:hypothetical protein